MQFLQCDATHYDMVTSLYHRATSYLQVHINYPLWTDQHPSDSAAAEAIRRGEQFICIQDGAALGAVVLNEDPDGHYENGDWSRQLSPGEFLVVHVLAVDPACQCGGVGSFMVEQCIALARRRGYRAIRLDVVPGNIPAERLYRKFGFTYAGTHDLNRPFVDIPLFDLYELNLDE